MEAAAAAREARRRRLVDRGGDRLAFITGQTQSIPKGEDLPPSAGSSQSEGDAPTSLPAKVPTKIQAGDQITNSAAEIDTRKELFPKHETGAGLPNFQAINEISESMTSNESSLKHGTDNSRRVEPSTTAVTQRSSDTVGDSVPHSRVSASKTNCISFSPGKISGSISASEDIRLLCSITMALLVVLSYHGYSLVGKAMGSIISSRPLLWVLLTDATVVIGWLLVNQGGERKEEEARKAGQDGWDAGKTLEAVMLLQKATSAAFMDCIICAVIIICGIVA